MNSLRAASIILGKELRTEFRTRELLTTTVVFVLMVLILFSFTFDPTAEEARRYTPGRFPGRVSLILPCRAWVHSGKEALRWQSLAQDAEVYYGPDGCNGDNMLREPFAPAFAGLFRRCRDGTLEISLPPQGGVVRTDALEQNPGEVRCV